MNKSRQRYIVGTHSSCEEIDTEKKKACDIKLA